MLQGDEPDSEAAPSRRLTELLATALLDQELGERLFADPEAIGRAFDLPAAEIKAIKLLDRARFEQTIARIRWG